MHDTIGVLLFLVALLYVDGASSGPLYLAVDAGTESLRVGIFDREGHVVSSHATPYETQYPNPGYFEQKPEDWYESLGTSCKKALEKANIDPSRIVAMSCDTTACSVCVLDKDFKPLRSCILWADSRSAQQTEEIMLKAKGDAALQVNCDGHGPLSAEWMLPKSLWLKQKEPDLWKKSVYICEKQDLFNYWLTKRYVASGCNTAARWHWNAREACQAPKGSTAGRPVGILEAIGLEDLLQKWPQDCLEMGGIVGTLTEEASYHLGLGQSGTSIKVIQGGPDAYVGMIGLGCIEPGKLGLITGSSHLHLAISAEPATANGIWGSYVGAPLRDLCFAEGGQSSTGSAITWAKRIFSQGTGKEGAEVPKVGFKELDEECAESPPGARGLLCIETFQGSRTPVTDAKARGALVGLTLAHKRGDIWRAMLEAICFGTRAAIEAMQRVGLGTGDEILVTGGATRSPIFLQMHADVTGKTVIIGETDNAVLLGAAVLARAGSSVEAEDGNNAPSKGILAHVKSAVADMVRESARVEPRLSTHARYTAIYQVYRQLAEAIRDTSHILAQDYHLPISVGDRVNRAPLATVHQPIIKVDEEGNRRKIYVVPSILAGDFGNLQAEAKLCIENGCEYLHVDMCDGGDLAQGALTLGPQAIAAVARKTPELKLDVHLVAQTPGKFIKELADAGATRLTVQYETLAEAVHSETSSQVALYGLLKAFAMAVNESGMKMGICVAPATPIEEVCAALDDLCEGSKPLIEFIDILAVKPGRGGQTFDPNSLLKLAYVHSMYPGLPFLGVDGGITVEGKAAQEALAHGANYIIAGSAIFGRDRVAGVNDMVVVENLSKLIQVALEN